MEKDALSEASFAEFGKQVVLFCHVTSRVEGDPYQQLLQEKGGRGFPHLAFMDAEGNVLAKPGDRSVAGFQKTLEACQKFAALDKKAKAGDKSVAADLLIARIEMGGINFADAKEAEAALGKVDAKKKAKIFDLMLDLEVSDAMTGVRSVAQAVEVGKTFQKMWDENRVPKGDSASTFFAVIMEAAADAKDAKGYEKALHMYEKVAPEGRNRDRMLERMRERLKTLK